MFAIIPQKSELAYFALQLMEQRLAAYLDCLYRRAQGSGLFSSDKLVQGKEGKKLALKLRSLKTDTLSLRDKHRLMCSEISSGDSISSSSKSIEHIGQNIRPWPERPAFPGSAIG
jgi:hypothetical protein